MCSAVVVVMVVVVSGATVSVVAAAVVAFLLAVDAGAHALQAAGKVLLADHFQVGAGADHLPLHRPRALVLLGLAHGARCRH